VHGPGRPRVRTALERHFSDRNPRQLERRYLEYQRRRTLVHRWLRQGIPHADRVVQVEGLRHLEEAISGGTGAILASAHFGHGRLIKPVLGVHGWPALLVGEQRSHMPVSRLDGRRARGEPTPPRWPQIASADLPVTLNLRPHLAALQENRPLIIMVDGRSATSLTDVMVLSIGVPLAPGAVRIARAARAPVLPTFAIDEGTLRDPLAIRLVIHAPLALQSSGDGAADVLENLKRFAAVYGEELDRNPHNFNWRYVDPESGRYGPPRDPQSREPGHEEPPLIAGSERVRPRHGP